MKNVNKFLSCLCVAFACSAGISQAAYASVAGHVQFVNGDVQITNPAGQAHQAQKGEAISEGDTLTSAPSASAQIKMQDGGFVAVRPDTQLKFDQFVFAGKQDGNEKSFFSLFKGGFRAVTGLIGQINKQNYKITTPTSTIGIRGTDHETFVVTPGSPLAAVAPAGAYNKVNLGETSMTTDKGTIFVLPNQMGFAGAKDQMPKLQPLNTNLFTVAAKPTPQAKSDKQEGKKESVRESAVVDATPPAAGSIPAATTPVTAGGTTAVPAYVPVTTTVPVNLVVDGQVINISTQNIGPVAGGTETAIGETAPFVNTEIAFLVASIPIGTVEVAVGPTTSISPVPNPTHFSFSYDYGNCPNCAFSYTYTLSGGTPTSFSDATTGAQWGYWTNVSQLTSAYTFPNYPPTSDTIPSPGVFTWITAPSVSPFYLPAVLQGAVSYNLVGGIATNGTNIGTINSASLSVNFTQQLVNLALNATVAGVNWVATGTGAPLMGLGNNSSSDFSFCTGCVAGGGTGALTVSATGGVTPSYASVYGGLTGNGLTGAIINFLFSGTNSTAPVYLTGVAALGLSPSTPINTATPYQIALSSMATTTPRYNYGETMTVGGSYPVTSDSVDGNAFNPTTLRLDAAGNPLSWQSGDSKFAGTVGAQTVTISGATASDRGTDPVSGINWGRWSGGTFSFVSLANGLTATQPNTPGGLHWITTPTMSAPISLPVSGTYNYVLAGGTRPVDQLGNLGTLNSASLAANFSAMTVNVAASVTVPAANVTFNGSATGVPIQQGTFFEVGAKNGTFGTLTCTGTGCGPATATAGKAVGVFTQSGIGAALSYGFETGSVIGSPTTVVSGVAAFHR